MSAPTPAAARVLRFDAFELNLHAAELRRRGVKLRLQGQPVQVLAILLKSAGHLVTREELRAALWPADTFVDFDHSLHNAIARIREVLDDSADTPRYIETLPRRGYRFIAPVEEAHALPIVSPNGRKNGGRKALEPPEARPTSAPRTTRMGLLLGLSGCAITIIALGAWQLARPKAAALSIRSIAVLPLQNLSGDATQEYFADGMTEELITEMSRIQSLKVISRTSVMGYKGTTKHLPQIASELGVDGIVEGSVVRDGDQVRVTVQLLEGPNDRHLWSDEYQRPLHDVLDLQREIAQTIARQVSAQITAEQQARFRSTRPVGPEVYDAYLRGRYYLNTQFSTPRPLNTARTYFEASVRNDPGFAPPYAGLADVYINQAFFRQLPPEQAYRSAKRALDTALRLDDSLSEAHAVLAILNWQYEWDWAAAEREFTYSIALNSSYDCLRNHHANYLAWRGVRDKALAELSQNRELNPASSYTNETAVYFQLGDYRNLVDAGRKAVAADPSEWLGHYFLGVGYESLGRRADAIPEFEKAVEMSGGDQDPRAALAHGYAVLGKRAEAQRILDDLTRQSADRYVSPYMIATIYAGLGDTDKAFAFLDKALQERSLDIVWNLKVDPRVDNLRSDPRFRTLWQRVGFPQDLRPIGNRHGQPHLSGRLFRLARVLDLHALPLRHFTEAQVTRRKHRVIRRGLDDGPLMPRLAGQRVVRLELELFHLFVVSAALDDATGIRARDPRGLGTDACRR